MSGKQSKREAKLKRREEREAALRKERQRTIATVIIIGLIVALGGVIIALSLDDGDPVADELDPDEFDLEELLEQEDLETDEAPEDGAPEDQPGDDPAEDPAADNGEGPAGDPAADSGEDAAADDRPVACGAQEPPAAGEPKPTFDEPEQVVDADADYRAVIATSCGEVVVDLDAARAPETVNSFVFLAQEGFFDGLEIFRNATSIGALQTGAGTNDASWQVGYTLDDELQAAEEDGYPPGAVAMANAGPDTGGSQFFFVYNENFQLPPDYARFGTVTEGLDVLEEIGDLPVDGETPQERAYMDSVTIETG